MVSHGSVRITNFISNINDKVILQREGKFYLVVLEKAYLYSSSGSLRRDYMASALRWVSEKIFCPVSVIQDSRMEDSSSLELVE